MSYKRVDYILPGVVLWISSDRDNQRIFFGLKCSSPGFFICAGWGVGKFGKYFFRWFDLSRDFLGYPKQSEDP